MSRWVIVAFLMLLAGMLVVARVMEMRRDPTPIPQKSQVGPVAYDIKTHAPKPDALFALQWLADGVRCPVTDNVSLMASCVLQRYGKMRDKALSARARYEALVGLERAYWANLAREGLTQRIEHVQTREGN